MGRNLTSRRRLFEALELRRLLAGNVAAEVISGDLFITGDAAANVFELSGTGIDGQVVIRPAESSVISDAMYPVQVAPQRELVPLDPDSMQPITASPTTINGSTAPQLFSGVLGRVVIVTGDGRDTIAITNLRVHSDLVIDSGAQHDAVVLGQYPQVTELANGEFEVSPGSGSIAVGRSLQINLGDGDDRQTGSRVFVGGDVLVEAGSGNDRPELFESSARNMSFSLGAGDDRLYLEKNTTTGAMTLLLGDGANDVILNHSTTLGSAGMVGGAGIDQLRLDNSRFESGLVAVMGDANDYVELSRSVVAGTATVLGGGGGERLLLDSTRAGTLSFDLGSGNDQLLVKGAQLDAVYGQLGDGDDWLDIRTSMVARSSAIGGAGTDSLGAFAVPGASPIAMFSVGFEAAGAVLPTTIREAVVPNTRYLVQRLTPTPGTGAVSGGAELRFGGYTATSEEEGWVLIGGGTLNLSGGVTGSISEGTINVGGGVLNEGFIGPLLPGIIYPSLPTLSGTTLFGSFSAPGSDGAILVLSPGSAPVFNGYSDGTLNLRYTYYGDIDVNGPLDADDATEFVNSSGGAA